MSIERIIQKSSQILKFNSLESLLNEGGLCYRFFSDFRHEIFVSALFMALAEIAAQTIPLVQKQLICLVEAKDNNFVWKGYIFCFTTFLLQILRAINGNYSLWLLHKTSLKIRSALICQIHGTILDMTDAVRQAYPAGKIVSLASSDAYKIETTLGYLHLYWFGPVQVIITATMLATIMGISALAGIAILLVTLPFQYCIFRLLTYYRKVNLRI